MPAPLQIFLAWCLLLPAVWGLGLLAARALPGPTEPAGFSLSFWLGVTALCVIALVWHLVFPIDGRFWILLGPAAALGLLLEWRGGLQDCLRWLRARRALLLPLLAFALWLAGRAALPTDAPDDHLYFTQTVRWHSLHPAVPGLGNLHPLLAFNNAYHLLVAAFGVGPFTFRGDRLANGLLLVAVVGACWAGLLRVLAGPAPAPADVLGALLLGPALDFSLSDQLSCPGADFAVHMAGTGLLLAGLGPVLRGGAMGARQMNALVAACAGAVLLKQSLICVALPVALFALGQGLLGRPRAEQSRLLRGVALIALASAIPWMAHGVVLSGFPLFPARWPDLGVSWRMNPEVLEGTYHWVHAFARWPGHSDAEVTASAAWVGKWFGREWLNDRAFLLPAVVAAAGALALLAARLAGRRPPRSCLAALSPVALGLAIWWLLAPDLRFAGPLLWTAADLLALAALLAWRPVLDAPARVFVAACALLIAAGAFVGWQPSVAWPARFPPLHHNQGTRQARLSSGETVDVAGQAGCWDPPCGWPPLDPRLRLRKPGDWSSGLTLQPPTAP